ncbi:hypothetical protein BAAM0483_06875 [Bifidobacterium animalis subsp. animalis MCC 0483]|uniref:Uncharacterized protein n=1 Tax=Bifidobacterium animalis subsp. animalis MCC 0483 TaxID=1365955 RepID=A0AB34T8P9_9BIFI|nr:DMT family transporter [Bifidobacterium animalis]KOA48836.1 hypothetical protein BAAM0483_06875 [Bifidobacterium animalis subsp. animalis MCC 0483]QQQ90753.1 DMT family transporter [Bifidobacterium animalis]RYM91594.1 hypothetical protein PG2007B_1405 [Bifidobacterium animalis subsp. lactis]RYM91834.1 hypothetical protein PG2010B_1349 [Bifidobacterium animalis subsp. lactis]UQE62750.1 DMT family transporter [Bifidobacterium animalis]
MNQTAAMLRAQHKRMFFSRGLAFALTSGLCYGLYTAFLTLGETQAPWGTWFAGESALSSFTVIFALAALAAGINDVFSGIWSLSVCAKNGQLTDLRKTVNTKPGRIMMLCALVGGPGATVCYVIALNSATASGNPGVIVPIAALNCAIGAILGRVLLKQKLAAHTVVGIVICLVSAALVGGASFAIAGSGALIGCLFAFLAAFGWGFEGCIAGFGTALIEYHIGITIRQVTAGVLELVVMFPLLTLIGGNGASIPEILRSVIANPSVLIFVISGFFAMPAYSFWYKGNSMCGTALGMACNGTYAFWGPFFIWLILGAFNIGGMSTDYPPLGAAQWIGALVMILGIFVISVNPLSLFAKNRKGEKASESTFVPAAGNTEQGSVGEATANGKQPLYYAIMLHFASGETDCASGVINSLKNGYANHKQLESSNVDEALATAKENGLLDEAGSDVDKDGKLRIWYQMNPFGKQMVDKYVLRAD